MTWAHFSTLYGRGRNLNKHAILDLIRFTPGGISRADLAREMGLSRSAVTAIVGDLIEAGLVREAANGIPAGGRRPILLEVNAQGGYVAGIDIGATHLMVLLADLAAQVVHEVELPCDILDGPGKCLQQVDRCLRDLLAGQNLGLEKILAIGVGVPGPVAAGGGKVIAPPIMPGWDDFPILDHLKERWHLPVILNNDAELGALGEWAYGAGRLERNLVFIKVGTGVGAGLVIENQVYRGENGTAGEIGHVTMLNDGPVCTCGNRGCLEAVAGGQAIVRMARQVIRSNVRTQIGKAGGSESITVMDVIDAARLGDLEAQKIVVQVGTNLGIALAGLINVLNPGIVVIGGGVSQSGDLLLEPIRETVRKRALKAAVQSVRITTAVLGRRSVSMGAVVQALTVVLHDLAESEPGGKH